MVKIQRIFETNQEINFISPKSDFSLYLGKYYTTKLGKVSNVIPWQELVRTLKIKDKKKGPTSMFSPRGKLALMFLKAYTSLSDSKLIENLNGNLDYQIFCDLFLGTSSITNPKIVSSIRCELSSHLKINGLQKCLAEEWKPYLTNTNVLLEDATCYETSMRNPTNVKLLWESIELEQMEMKHLCKRLKVPTPRNKYLDIRLRYSIYSKKRKKTIKERIRLTRGLLKLLGKILSQLGEIENHNLGQIKLPKKYYRTKILVQKVFYQQREMFRTGESVPDRIVSISKSYIRPIVRGKEIKKVEYGAKVNMIQIDGINFIEHLSFNAFNEGTRFKNSIRYGRELFGKITHIAADKIYATNDNRAYSRREHIITNFVRKGYAGKYEDQRIKMAKVLNIERSTRMEGSFGTEKEHYGLNRIKARTKKNEILWIVFGVHTANAIRILEKIKEAHKKLKAA